MDDPLDPPLSTFDLDIVHSTDPANITRLLAAFG
jgi:hypothetical protein